MKLETVERWVDTILDVLDAPAKHQGGPDHYHNLALKYFTPVEPLIVGKEELTRTFRGESFERSFFFDVHPHDVDDWDLSFIRIDESSEERFQLSRFRRLALSKLRGYKIPSSWVGEWAHGFLFHDQTALTARALLAWQGNGWLESIPIRFRQRNSPSDFVFSPMPLSGVQPAGAWKPAEEEIANQAQLMLGAAFTRYYEWTVTLGRENGLAIRFVTDPEGARAVFRLRDIPDGRERRAALRRWIVEHWRKNRKTEEEKTIKVRQHLRGETRFIWRGLTCEIVPSAYDIKRDALLAYRRAMERGKLLSWASERYSAQITEQIRKDSEQREQRDIA